MAQTRKDLRGRVLRKGEAQLMKDQMDGLDIYVAGKATVNFVFDRYMSLKNNLKLTTKSNYLYMYDRFIRDTFGKTKQRILFLIYYF